jgi:hypothetical protein
MGRVVAVATTVAVLAMLVQRFDAARVRSVFSQVRWWYVAAAAALNILNTAIESLRWTVLASSVKAGARPWSAFKGLLASALGNLVLPFKLGDGVRAYAFARAEALSFTMSVSTVVLDRTVDGICFLALVVVAGATYPLPPAVSRSSTFLLFSLLGLLFVLVVVLSIRRFRKSGVQPAVRSRAAMVAAEFIDGLSALKRWRLLVPALGLGLLSWAARGIVVLLMCQAFNLSIPLIAVALVLILTTLGMALVGTPGNLGAFEIAAAGALTLFSVPRDVALSVGAAYHVVELLPLVVLGLVLVWTGHLVIRRAPPSSVV